MVVYSRTLCLRITADLQTGVSPYLLGGYSKPDYGKRVPKQTKHFGSAESIYLLRLSANNEPFLSTKNARYRAHPIYVAYTRTTADNSRLACCFIFLPRTRPKRWYAESRNNDTAHRVQCTARWRQRASKNDSDHRRPRRHSTVKQALRRLLTGQAGLITGRPCRLSKRKHS